MKTIRYEYLIDSIHIIKPKKIIEVGIAQGLRSSQMIKEAKIFNDQISFHGYDVFDKKSKQWHRMVGNSKQVLPELEIKKTLSSLGAEINLYPGMTMDTLWDKNVIADLVFIDGDHRIEAINNDYLALKNSKVIAFDDYYISGKHDTFSIDRYGCNKLVNKFSKKQVFISPKTIKFPEIRIAFWSENEKLIKELNDTFC